MSTTIDRNVVEMRFDNQQFERNVKTTKASLEDLRNHLDLKGATKGFENVDSAAKKVDVSGLGKAVENVGLKFNAMYTMADQALRNITTRVMSTAENMAKALTIEPIMAGFSEYETQMGAIQTILANTKSKGSTLDDVNSALDELNKYADQTIYNFTEMTRNIGTFTAAGVDLDKSVTSIRGIANLAAVSGSTSQQASTAMYQLSQALASGKVSLMDWNSVVNAGMGGQVFQDALKRTAKHMGTDVDAMIEKYGSFRESLTQGEWLTADVLTETLTQLSGAYTEAELIAQGYTEAQAKEIVELANTAVSAATEVKTFTQLWDTLKESAQSGWTTTWEILVGDFEEAKELLTGISNVVGEMIGKSAEARNALLQGWKDAGGRTMLIESLTNVFNGLMQIIKPIKEAFSEIFPPMTVEQLVKFTEGFRDLTAKFKLTDEQTEKLKTTFKGIFSLIDIGVTIIKAFASGVWKVVKSLFGLVENVLDISSALGSWFTDLRDGVKAGGNFEKAIDGIATVLAKAADGVKKFMDSGFSTIGTIFSDIWNVVKKIGSKLGDAISKVFSGIGDAFSSGNFDPSTILSIASAGLFAGLLSQAKKFFNSFKDMVNGVVDAFSGIGENISGIFDTLGESLKTWQQSIKVDMILKIAYAIGILTISLLILSTIEPEQITNSLGAITTLFIELVAALKILGSGGAGIDKGFATMSVMIGMAISIAILASALKKVSDLGMDQIVTGMVGLAGLATIMVQVVKQMAKIGKTAVKGATNIVILSAALLILAQVCKELATMSWGELAKGLVGVAGLLAALLIFTNGVKANNKFFTVAVATTVIAAALKILANVCKDFAAMDMESIGKALLAISVLLGEVVLVANNTSSTKHIVSTAIAMTIMAGAIYLLAEIFEKIALMSLEDIGKGLLVIAGSMATLVIAVNKLNAKDLMEISIVFPTISGAMIVLAEAFERVGKIEFWDLVKGLGAMTAAMAIMVAAIKIINKADEGDVWTIIGLAAALLLLAPALAVISGIGIAGAVASIISLAGTFTTLGIAAKILDPLMPSLLKLAGSIAAIGGSFIILGAGITAIGAGLVFLFTSLGMAILTFATVDFWDIVKGIVAIAAVFAVIGTAATILKPAIGSILSLSGALALLGLSALAIGAAIAIVIAGLSTLSLVGEDGAKVITQSLKTIIVGFLETVKESIPILTDIAKETILGLLEVLVECIPEIVDGVLKVVMEVCASLSDYGPKIIDFLLIFVIDLINGLAKHMPQIIEALFNLIGSVVEGVISALNNLDTQNLINAITAFGLIGGMMWMFSSIAGLTGGALLGVLGIGAVMAEMALVLAAIGGLAQIPGLEWLISEGGDFLQVVGTAIGQFVGGLAGGFMAGMTSSLPEVGTYLSQFMINAMPFIMGIKMVDWSILEGVGALTAAIIALSVADFINGVAAFYGLGDGLADLGTQLSEFMINAMPFIMMAKDIDPNIMVGIKNLAGAVLALTSANLLDQLTSWLGGDASLASFGEELAAFGPSLKEFADSVKDVDPQSLMAAANASKALGEMAAALPSSGGVFGFFTGENDIDVFGTQLVSFGESLTEYSKTVAGIDANSIAVSVEALTALSGAAKEIDNFGGVVSWFCGDNSMDTFGQQLESFGTSLKNYSDTISDGSGINLDAINTSVEAIIALAGAAKEIDNFGGVVSWFCGDNSLDTFGEQLSAFGNALSGYNKTLTENELNIDAIKNSAVAIEALAGAAGAIEDFGGVVSWFAGDNGLDTFGTHLESFGKSLAIYDESIADIDTAKLNQVSRSFDLLIDVMKDMDGTNFGSVSAFAYNLGELGNASVDKFISAFENSGQKAEKASEDLFKKIIDAIEGKDAQIKASGRLTMRNFAAGLAESGSVITSGIGAALTQAIADLHSFYQKFRDLGSYLVDGFANGIDANKYSAAAKARAMAAAAEEAAREELLVFSPSRKGYAIGNFFGIGFVNALVDSVGRAYDASVDVAIAARTGLSDALGRVSDLINSDIDSQPTIRPVLDLSDVEAGANRIGGMFGINPSVGVLANVGSINSMMNRRSQNGSNAEVVAAIKDLRDRVGTKSGDTYNLNGLSYTEGDDVGAAFKTIVRAARMERRT